MSERILLANGITAECNNNIKCENNEFVGNKSDKFNELPHSANNNFFHQYLQFRTPIVWRNVNFLLFYHISAVYSIYLVLSGQVKFATFAFAFVLGYLNASGVTAGAHRLWSHRSYKATWQFRIILLILHSMAIQNSIYDWVRDHRVHHKYTETDGDPHNAARGFFFSHMGWLMLRKHPEVIAKGNTIDLSDIRADPIVMFQKRNSTWFAILVTFIMPTLLTYYVTGDTFWNAWFIGGVLRYMAIVHLIWSVNSFAHFSGYKPYDKNIAAANNTIVGILGIGEGWHNYHHVFPWDYKTSELGTVYLNATIGLINLFAKIGWAYDLKTVSDELIRKRAERTGDGLPYPFTNCVKPKSAQPNQPHGQTNEHFVWGWDDTEMDKLDKQCAVIEHKKSV